MLRESVEINIKTLNEKIKEFEKYIVSIIKKDKELSLIYNILMEQDGVARENAFILIN